MFTVVDADPSKARQQIANLLAGDERFCQEHTLCAPLCGLDATTLSYLYLRERPNRRFALKKERSAVNGTI